MNCYFCEYEHYGSKQRRSEEVNKSGLGIVYGLFSELLEAFEIGVNYSQQKIVIFTRAEISAEMLCFIMARYMTEYVPYCQTKI